MAWRYACNIPTHITGKDENGEPVVLYRVNVFFQQQNDEGSGQSNGAALTDSAPFFVLRRYSQFRHLHDQLKAVFPSVMSARGMAPPPKHPLVLGDKRDALERRRGELERWLWRLIGTAEVARGPQLKSFLEFDKALARAQQQQQQQRRRLEQQRLLADGSTPLADADFARGVSPSATPSEASYGPAATRRHLAYPGGGGSVAGDDSVSDASGPSVAASTTALTSMAAAAAWAAGAGAGGASAQEGLLAGASHGGGAGYAGHDARVAVPGGGGEHERAEPPHHQDRRQQHGQAAAAGGAAAAALSTTVTGNGGAAADPLARLGIHLQSRADVRRLVDVLVQRLETACSEATEAISETSMLRDANRAMAERLGELELERAGEGPAAELRARLAESDAARTSLEQLAAQLQETLTSRSTAHAQQVSQLQAQLAEARDDNGELLRRLQEWDVGGNAAATLVAQQRADELQRRVDELQERVDELQQRAEQAQRGAAELQGQVQQRSKEVAERSSQVELLQARLAEQEQQLVDERKRREQAEAAAAAAAARQPLPAPPPQQQQQAALGRARADNALLAQEVQRLRALAAQEREAHKKEAAAAAAHSTASAQLQARIRDLEAQVGGGQQQLQQQQQE